MHEFGLTNASKLDKITCFQTFRSKDKGSSIPRSLVGGSSDLSDIVTYTSCHSYMSRWIDPNSNREEWCDNH